MKKLFLINCRKPMIDAFKAAGHDVRYIFTAERDVDVSCELEKIKFHPDILLQQESLGSRVFLHGLASVNCVRLFWSVDTHMNMHWHGLYGSMFDGVLTTQKKYVSQLEKVCTSKICWVPWMGGRLGPETGTETGLIPYTKREHELTFVGRVSPQRPSRKWFVDFLKTNYNLNMVDGLNYSQMMSLYKQTRIVPNEALFGEVNFRLFEGCSCGCAVVTPFVGDELEELFEDGKEIAVYNDVLELKDILDRLKDNPKLVASMGLAAYERVLRDHMPANRVAKILDFAQEILPRSIHESEAYFYYYQALAVLGETGGGTVSWDNVIEGLKRSFSGIQRDAALLRIFAKGRMVKEFMDTAKLYLNSETGHDDCYFNMSASVGSNKIGNWDLAKYFWYRYCAKVRPGKEEKPLGIVHLLMLWGQELSRVGTDIRSGVLFNEDKDLPACAADCYLVALHLDPENLEVYRSLESLLSGIAGAESMRLGFLSHLSLHHPDDWRISAELGIVNLKVFRLNEGLAELKNSKKKAMVAGCERFWSRKIEKEVNINFEIVGS
ncbi:glycosyltransferase [Maridesulfovibrio ferrireducens]|uniref:glycosyltransferase family protein n=1 Tax=Maridesulfovibrio ferrireducens TaxID=246191 RepID=UPI001A1E1EE9|nr:glycosyltransferase [Maridesulfovibrio ferrireducens]MBI9110788.1 glycosyltransferase family 1 protein [Maridesulfovibrio ferrireducens]